MARVNVFRCNSSEGISICNFRTKNRERYYEDVKFCKSLYGNTFSKK